MKSFGFCQKTWMERFCSNNKPQKTNKIKQQEENLFTETWVTKQNSLNPKWQKEKAIWETVLCKKEWITGIMKEPKIHDYNYYLVEETHKKSCLTAHLQFKRENETQMNKCQNTILLSWGALLDTT